MITNILTTLIVLSLIFSGCSKKDETKDQSQSSSQKIEETSQNKSEKETQPEVTVTRTDTADDSQENSIILTTIDDKKIKLLGTQNGITFQGYEDKVVILDFFATWCPPCKASLPHLVDLQKKYNEKVQFLGILMEENKDMQEIRAFAKKYNINFPVTNSPENFSLSSALGGVRSLPTTVIYDKEGNYFKHYLGAIPVEMLDAEIKKVLNK
jgi:thiol-disulfide isomerase/thioredoxin